MIEGVVDVGQNLTALDRGRETLHVLWFKAECFFGNQLWRISKDLCLKKNISRWKVR